VTTAGGVLLLVFAGCTVEGNPEVATDPANASSTDGGTAGADGGGLKGDGVDVGGADGDGLEGGGGDGGSGGITGASQAQCAIGVCGTPTGYTTTTLSVDEGTGTMVSRFYRVYRPLGLTNSPSNKVPAVLLLDNGNPNRFVELAAANRFIAVTLYSAWIKKWVNRGPGAPAPVNDEPFIAAVVNDLYTRENVDPNRLYVAGASGGGGEMVLDIMCDPANSKLFRGYLADSTSFGLYPYGQSAAQGAQPVCPSTNTNYFAMEVLSNTGSDANMYYNATTPGSTGKQYFFDLPDWTDWMAKKLNCGGARQDTSFGSPDPTNFRKFYSGPCNFAASGSPAVETIGVPGGGYMFGCQDSDPSALGCRGGSPLPTNGLFVEKEFWDFVANGVSKF
jgi:hypothetical protein